MKISQREARRLRKRVDELEGVVTSQRRKYGQEWPGGVQVAHVTLSAADAAAIRTARKLSHAVVAVSDDTDEIRFMALPHPESGL